MKPLSSWRNKTGATATNPKMMPRQHISDPTTHRDVGAKEIVGERVMQGWWGAPEFRVPTGRWYGKRGASQATIRTRCTHEHFIQHTCIRSRAVVSGLYLQSVHFRGGSSSMRCRGSSRTCFVNVRGRR